MIDIARQLTNNFVDIHQVYVLKHHVHRWITDDRIRVARIDTEDYQARNKKKENRSLFEEQFKVE